MYQYFFIALEASIRSSVINVIN